MLGLERVVSVARTQIVLHAAICGYDVFPKIERAGAGKKGGREAGLSHLWNEVVGLLIS